MRRHIHGTAPLPGTSSPARGNGAGQKADVGESFPPSSHEHDTIHGSDRANYQPWNTDELANLILNIVWLRNSLFNDVVKMVQEGRMP